MRQVVLISGHLGAGKSGLAHLLHKEFGYHRIQTSRVLSGVATERGRGTDRRALQALGDELDAESGSKWVLQSVAAEATRLPDDTPIVVDSVRTSAQLAHFRGEHSLNVVHVHLYAPLAELIERFERKHKPQASTEEYTKADLIKSDQDIASFREDADVRIKTTRNDSRDILARVAARLGLLSQPDVRCVDVIVGGQFGSEGKGHVAAYLAKDYDVLLRVGGPNAGHTVSSRSGIYVYHHLPSGCKDTKARLLLGPGMTIYVPALLKEIEDCGITPDRLFIDPQAMIIEEQDRLDEATLRQNISSTGSGSGFAASRRIRERGSASVRLARDVPELHQYVGTEAPYRGSTAAQLELAYRRRLSILLEGTQGSGLSIFHGSYPHVTSRDTNVAGCLAEAGISPSRVRRIIMVVRPTPIRVADPIGTDGKSSGPLKHLTTFAQIAEEAGLDPQELQKNEKTSTTKRDRRVGWFEWEQFRAACALNAPTDIALTFADYVAGENVNARRFEQLTPQTIKFIEELERVAQAPISLINTRFPRPGQEVYGDLRTIIDRRNWSTDSAAKAAKVAHSAD